MDFPIFQTYPDLVYLDNAATTQKPIHVINTINHFYTAQNANIHRGIYNLSEEATKCYEQARATVASLINAQANEIVFTSGTTLGINLLSQALTLEAGDEIVLTEMEHHSNILPWQKLAKEKNLILKYIPLKNFELDMEAAKDIITDKTKIVSVTHISNVLGTKNDIAKLTELAHTKGALIIIDAAQSAAHMPIDVKQLDVDFLLFSGHKAYGPTGIGVLYGKENLLRDLPPLILGGGMVQEVNHQESTYVDIPYKHEAGTPPIAQALGLAAAVKYIQNIGLDKIQQQEQELSEYAIEKLKQLENINLYSSNGTVIAFTVDNVHPHDVAEILNRNNIAVRAGHHCAQLLHKKLNIQSTVRISLALYNSKADIDKLIVGLAKVQEILA